MKFSEIIGQDELKSHFIDQIQKDKISHAQLFLGKNGYGALPLALAFVQYLFCTEKNKNDSCGVCPSCLKVQDLQHPDLHFSFPVVLKHGKTSNEFLKEWRNQIKNQPYFDLSEWNSNFDKDLKTSSVIGTDESMEIIKKLTLKSFEGGYKVMLIWMAEKMNTVCSNKILKILEEPPARTLFILMAESSDQILPTIISRTQLVKIPRLKPDNLQTYLSNLKNQIEPFSDKIIDKSEGNIIQLINLIENEKYSETNRDLFIELMRSSYRKNVSEMLHWAEKISKLNLQQKKDFLQYCLYMVRQSLIKNYDAMDLNKTTNQENDFLIKFAKFITGKNVSDFVNLFSTSIFELERNANSSLLFTVMTFKVGRYIHFA